MGSGGDEEERERETKAVVYNLRPLFIFSPSFISRGRRRDAESSSSSLLISFLPPQKEEEGEAGTTWKKSSLFVLLPTFFWEGVE